jgi:hypothetical protein
MLRMRRSTWVAIAGLTAAGAVLALGPINTWWLEQRTARLQTQCEAENAKRIAEQKAHPSEDGWEYVGMACDPRQLTDVTVPGVQRDIADAYRQAWTPRPEWPKPVALALIVLGLAPWAWYFLLRRIAELRSAIGGNPPVG